MTDSLNFAPGYSLARLTASTTAARRGIDNTIPPELLDNALRLSWLLYAVDEELKAQWGIPLLLSSGYRGHRLNVAVLGSKSSMHMKALAADISVPGVAPHAVAGFIAERMVGDYDQIIQEFTWVHIGLAESFAANRGELLTAIRNPITGKTEYSYGLV